MSCGEIDGSFPPSTHVITLVKLTGSYWSKLSDTLTVRRQRKTLSGVSSGEVTTTYCSILVYIWLLSWGDNPRHLCYHYSKPDKLKTVTSQQCINIAKVEFISIRVGNCTKNQVFTLHLKPKKA